MEAGLRKSIETALERDRSRTREHQCTVSIRLTQQQAQWLDDQQQKYGLKRGTYLRRLMIIDMLKRTNREAAAV